MSRTVVRVAGVLLLVATAACAPEAVAGAPPATAPPLQVAGEVGEATVEPYEWCRHDEDGSRLCIDRPPVVRTSLGAHSTVEVTATEPGTLVAAWSADLPGPGPGLGLPGLDPGQVALWLTWVGEAGRSSAVVRLLRVTPR
jgi:hypothetical protein